MRYRGFICIFIFLIIFLSMSIDTSHAQSESDTTQIENVQESSNSNLTINENAENSNKSGFSTETIMDLMGLAQEIGYLLIAVLVFGILFIFQQWYVLIREKHDAQKIPVKEFITMPLDRIEEMFTKVKDTQNNENGNAENSMTSANRVPLLKKIFRKKKASAFQLIQKLYLIFDAQKSTVAFNDETANYVQYLKDMFNPFMTRLAFLSDTAGALGLLGTVWGMFLVFYKGSPDPEDTLRGMGVALATTIIGLVISIILNSFTTVVSNVFDRHIDFINKMANAFQERLMKEEEPIAKTQGNIHIDTESIKGLLDLQKDQVSQQPTSEKISTSIKETQPVHVPEYFGPPSEISVISGDHQTGEVGSSLEKAILVEVNDSRGNPLEGENIVFSVMYNSGTFANHKREYVVRTNEEGRAETSFTLGKIAGEVIINVNIKGSTCRPVQVSAIADPTPASKLEELGGNLQIGKVGKKLPEPFVVSIKDRFDNPIPMYDVTFSLKKGDGKFQGSQNAHVSIKTNDEGLAEVFFIVGTTPGAREIEIEAKKVEPSKIDFEVFAV